MSSARSRPAVILVTGFIIIMGMTTFAQQSQDAQQQNPSTQTAAQSTQQPAQAAEQSRESMAVDSTASQWSFQGTWEGRPSNHASGHRIVWRDMVASRFRDGRIAEEWVITDLAERLLHARKL